jgi:hypothetical protein
MRASLGELMHSTMNLIGIQEETISQRWRPCLLGSTPPRLISSQPMTCPRRDWTHPGLWSYLPPATCSP